MFESSSVSEISLSDKAVKQIKRIMSENEIPNSHGLRVSVKGGGCSGLTYNLNFDSNHRDGDLVIEKDGVKLFVDGKSLFYLTGTELDFSDGLNGRGFIFNNPNAKKTCGCGESFAI